MTVKQMKDYHEKEKGEWEKKKSDLNKVINDYQSTCIQYDKDIKSLKEVCLIKYNKLLLFCYILFCIV